jgi:hypothetical protein
MSTSAAPPEAPNSDAADSSGLSVQSIARLVAGALCGMHRVNGRFVRVNATVGDDGNIGVDVTQMAFTSEDVSVRVLLYPTAGDPVPPGSVPGPRNAA